MSWHVVDNHALRGQKSVPEETASKSHESDHRPVVQFWDTWGSKEKRALVVIVEDDVIAIGRASLSSASGATSARSPGAQLVAQLLHGVRTCGDAQQRDEAWEVDEELAGLAVRRAVEPPAG